MQILKWFIAKVLCKLKGSNEPMNRYFRKEGAQIGENCNIYSNIVTSESYLIHIGNNVTISNGVQLVTHDNSICKVLPQYTDTFGHITIGDNSFIGAKVVILPGVTIPANTIVGSGSVVTKSFTEERTILGGNPAKVISTWDKYAEKNGGRGVNIENCTPEKVKELALWSADVNRIKNKI